MTVLQKAPARLDEPEIKVENLEEVVKELPPLLVRYWRERGDPDVVMDPDWQALLRQSAIGNVVLLTVRHEKTMIGFVFNLIHSHPSHRTVPHFTTLWFWLDPAYRVGLFGLKLAKENLRLLEEKAKAYGAPVNRLFIAAPDERTAALYERAGYTFLEAVYTKVLK